MPVRLISFEGKQTDDQKIKLDWKVVEQENIQVYQVEYSGNGKNFVRIGQINANTLAITNYTYTDALTRTGDQAYYRLKIIEWDSKTTYSKLISIKLPAGDKMIAYPVPARNELWIDWKNNDAESAEFMDASGRILKAVKKSSALQKVDLSALPTGVLFLKTKGNTALKLVKE